MEVAIIDTKHKILYRTQNEAPGHFRDGPPLKPKEAIDNLGNLDTNSIKDRQERVAEKLSMSIPAPKLPRPNPVISRYIGKRVRLQLKDGSVIVADLVWVQWDFVRLANIEEVSNGYKVTSKWGEVRADSIARIYAGDALAEKIIEA